MDAGCAPSAVTSWSWVRALGCSASDVCSRWRSMAKKTNSLSFFTGPPTDPPNHCREYGPFTETVELLAGSGNFWSALNCCSRKKPNPEPCQLFVPDFVITLMAAPAEIGRAHV